ncbi:hypothetical protein V7793_06485 [Streptomyces sp. KLMMK]|uniref:hypothetical protein n=1 Tax=Streptomyces sp. KLMMK TaxID=3109353 RepID=UPI002FFF260C
MAAPEQLDAWYRTHWTFRAEGEPFDAAGTVDGWIKGIYTGNSYGFIAHSGILSEEKSPGGVHLYTVKAGIDGVTDLEQHRTDLLPKP